MLSVRTHSVSVSPSVWSRRPARGVPAAILCGLLMALLVLVGCASGPRSAAQAGGGEFILFVPSSGSTLRIVSDGWVEAHDYEGETTVDRRTDFYSKNVYREGSSSAVKVCTDLEFSGIVTALESEGFDRWAAAGSVVEARAVDIQALELTYGGTTRHLAPRGGMAPAGLAAFNTCRGIFRDVFNALSGFQSGDKDFRFRE